MSGYSCWVKSNKRTYIPVMDSPNIKKDTTVCLTAGNAVKTILLPLATGIGVPPKSEEDLTCLSLPPEEAEGANLETEICACTPSRFKPKFGRHFVVNLI